MYDFNYPAVGSLLLAEEVAKTLHESAIDCVMKERDNLDHGAWIAASLLWDAPPAPVVLISLPGQEL